jgi:hypothetical protein
MDAAARNQLLGRLATAHGRLLGWARLASEPRVEATLAFGAAVSLHALLEPELLAAQHNLLDPAVAEELVADHARLAEDLDLLAELAAAEPASPDLPPLAAALREHLLRHVERDERALYGPLARLEVVPRSS